MDRKSKGATKRFTRKLILALVIALIIIAGAITIAYCEGTDHGAELYQQELQMALADTYNQGYADGQATVTSTIEAGELSGFGLCGETFSVYITFEGKTHEFTCDAGDVVDALPFR